MSNNYHLPILCRACANRKNDDGGHVKKSGKQYCISSKKWVSVYGTCDFAERRKA